MELPRIVITRPNGGSHEYYVQEKIRDQSFGLAAMGLGVGQRALLYVNGQLDAAAVRIGDVIKLYPNRRALERAALQTMKPVAVRTA